MTSISQSSAYPPAAASASKTTAPQQTASVSPAQPQASATVFQSGQQISQLSHLLTQLHVLQRLFTSLPPAVSGQGSPIAPWLSQLVLPRTPADIATWLQQGAGSNSLKALVTQLSQPDSPLARLLASLPAESQAELKALIRLAAEQRIAGAPAGRDENTGFILHLPQSNGREIRLHVDAKPAQQASKRPSSGRAWTVRLGLPVGESNTLEATAVWQDSALSLTFSCEQPDILTLTEQLMPQLMRRLKQLEIHCESVSFHQAQISDDSAPEILPQHGIRISV
ncbi:flagellar hook-length control protein FliK [Photobacterium halotolerans]|uniref:flagellar hook-length control protein FliK n=1 Tax=Photobacterium halotolerans TaxID=265726 RepID=UPI000697474A|nr:flagellar hook-length control protein FliK [Photobacterium halotolerans]